MSRQIPGRLLAAGCFLAIAAATLLAVLPHAQRSPDIGLDVPRQVRADAVVPVVVHGDLHGDGSVWVTLAAPGRRCAAAGAPIAVPETPVTDGFRAAGEAQFGSPGRYTACAWARRGDGEPQVLAQRAAVARAPAGRVEIAAPTIVDHYDALRISVRGFSEIPQPLTLLVLRDAKACDPVRPRYVDDDVVEATAVTGRIAAEMEENWLSEGRWTLCAVLGDPERPIAVARRPVLSADL